MPPAVTDVTRVAYTIFLALLIYVVRSVLCKQSIFEIKCLYKGSTTEALHKGPKNLTMPVDAEVVKIDIDASEIARRCFSINRY